jgi:hypothetical protein
MNHLVLKKSYNVSPDEDGKAQKNLNRRKKKHTHGDRTHLTNIFATYVPDIQKSPICVIRRVLAIEKAAWYLFTDDTFNKINVRLF